MKILIFGDDKNVFSPWIKEQLSGSAFSSLPVKTAVMAEAQMMLKSIFFDAIIYCVNDVSDNTCEKVSELKVVARKTPILMLTGVSHFPIAVEALKHGADTYVVKETASGMMLSDCLNVLVSRKYDYINRFSTTGVFPSKGAKAQGSYAGSL